MFWACALLTAVATTYAQKSTQQVSGSKIGTSPAFKRFQFTYLCVYFMMMAGDWLQGPYVYALYDSYGYSQEDIAVLFVAGFGSSMFFGTFVGSLADRLGRKRFCLLYTGLYIASCLTKHVKSFHVLMLGRLLGGIATSLLFSVFDAWMVCEHDARGFAPEWLSETFSTAAFGNSVVAITAGMVAQSAADSVKLAPTSEGSSIMYGGFCMPFDLAIIVLIIGGSVLYSTWAENYGSDGVEPATSADVEGGGEKSADAPPSVDPKKVELTFANLVDVQGLQKGITLMRRDPVIAICGMLQSLFEGSMYIFVFMWTPALTPAPASASAGGEESEGGGHIRRRMLLGRLLEGGDGEGGDAEADTARPPYGQMFATFMVCCMCGSSLFTMLSKKWGLSAEELLLRVFLMSSLALSVPVFFSDSPTMTYMAFLVFECCVGIYFPAMGTMKSNIVPEESRAALYNLFRVPLNVIVLGVLLSDMKTSVAFGWSSALLLSGAALQYHLSKRIATSEKVAVDIDAAEGSLDDLLSNRD
jgi:MFS family permease